MLSQLYTVPNYGLKGAGHIFARRSYMDVLGSANSLDAIMIVIIASSFNDII